MRIATTGLRYILLSTLLGGGAALAEVPAQLELCAECHGPEGRGVGFDRVPIIAGTPVSHLEEAMFAYRDGARRCVEEPRMCELMVELAEDELVALAAYFGSQERFPSGEEFELTLALNGGQVHEQQCAQCHVYPEDENVESALGIPLHAQRSGYLRLALDAYRNGYRDTLMPAMLAKLKQLDNDEIEALIHYYVSYRR